MMITHEFVLHEKKNNKNHIIILLKAKLMLTSCIKEDTATKHSILAEGSISHIPEMCEAQNIDSSSAKSLPKFQKK